MNNSATSLESGFMVSILFSLFEDQLSVFLLFLSEYTLAPFSSIMALVQFSEHTSDGAQNTLLCLKSFLDFSGFRGKYDEQPV